MSDIEQFQLAGTKSDHSFLPFEACFYVQSGKFSAVVRYADAHGATILVRGLAVAETLGLLVGNGVKVPATVLNVTDDVWELAFDSPLSGWRAESFLGRAIDRRIAIRGCDSIVRLAA